MFKQKILKTQFATHDVKQIIIQKPKGYTFIPGQAAEVSILKKGLENEKRPFTFTSLNTDPTLEFTIKEYPERKGITAEIHKLRAGDKISIDKPFGSISYQGPGTFIAGGAGVTPFIAILRQLKYKNDLAGNSLIFSNKTWKDIILEREFVSLLGEENVFYTLTEQKKIGYDNTKINKDYLKEKMSSFHQKFYLCGPPQFVKDIKTYLLELDAKEENIIQEG